MNSESIDNVLTLLRKINLTNGLHPGHTALTYLQNWSGLGGELMGVATLRLAAAFNEQLIEAADVIKSRKLPHEAEAGMLSTVTGLQNAFSIQGLTSAISNHVPSVPISLASFAMLAGIMNSGFEQRKIPEDVDQLIAEVNQLIEMFRKSAVEQGLKDRLVACLTVLACMLRNIEAVGVDAAMEAYASLVIKIAKTDAKAATGSLDEAASWLDRIASWGKRIAALGNFASGGAKLLEGGEQIAHLLT